MEIRCNRKLFGCVFKFTPDGQISAISGPPDKCGRFLYIRQDVQLAQIGSPFTEPGRPLGVGARDRWPCRKVPTP